MKSATTKGVIELLDEIPEPLQPVTWRDDALVLQFSYPPTINHYYVEWCQQGKVRKGIGKGGTNFRAEIYRLKLEYHQRLKAFTRDIQVEVQFTMPDRRKRDIHDNIVKPMCDALSYARFWEDDHIIADFRCARVGVEAPGKTLIRIQEKL